MLDLPFSRWDTWYAVVLNALALAAAVVAVVLLVRARRRWYSHDKAAWWTALFVLVFLNGVTIAGIPIPFGLFTIVWLWIEERQWERQLEVWAEQGV